MFWLIQPRITERSKMPDWEPRSKVAGLIDPQTWQPFFNPQNQQCPSRVIVICSNHRHFGRTLLKVLITHQHLMSLYCTRLLLCLSFIHEQIKSCSHGNTKLTKASFLSVMNFSNHQQFIFRLNGEGFQTVANNIDNMMANWFLNRNDSTVTIVYCCSLGSKVARYSKEWICKTIITIMTTSYQ